jgi:hypothetical protein
VARRRNNHRIGEAAVVFVATSPFSTSRPRDGCARNAGDADDGYALDLGDARADIASLMQLGAALFDWPDRRGPALVPSEAVHWFFGTARESGRQPPLVIGTGEEIESVPFTGGITCSGSATPRHPR